jgi:uncharacterized protein YbbC (DUF1343 family)
VTSTPAYRPQRTRRALAVPGVADAGSVPTGAVITHGPRGRSCHKHAGTLCAGVQVHVDDPAYDHARFRPWRLVALKALRSLRPEYALWRDFPYEYERDRLAIDVINGSALLREWVDDPAARPADLDALAAADEAAWREEREAVLLYR